MHHCFNNNPLISFSKLALIVTFNSFVITNGEIGGFDKCPD
jgi:hypothetical protein